jgi:mannosyl-oligosaccharide alpha-1,2-mannosidase
MLYFRASRTFWLLVFSAALAVYYLSSRSPSRDVGYHDTETHYELGKGRFEVPPGQGVPASVHWVKPSEHFPVPMPIQLPIGKPRSIPPVQHKFPVETEEATVERRAKLDAIQSTFKRSWEAYRTRAWMHDELSPVSGSFKDPFNGWGAMLIDSLDTLRIMGLKQEFLDAVDALQMVDFTRSIRSDIPIFETTIRYLGGLLITHDISGAQHKVLLSKAVELADVLIGAFDTPNRMPIMYYHWDP